MDPTSILVVTHGSRRPEFLDWFNDLKNYLENRLSGLGLMTYVSIAHNEYSSPNWRDVLREHLSRGIKRIIIALAFLGPGNHVVRDIMGSLNIQEFNKWVRASWGGYEFEAYVTKPLIDSILVREALLLRIINALDIPTYLTRYVMSPEEIERNSINRVIELVRRELNTDDQVLIRLVAKAVFATGNPALVKYVYVDPRTPDVFKELINNGVTVVADTKMVMVGLRWGNTVTLIDDAETTKLANELGITRAAASMRIALSRYKPAIPIIGNSPTALVEVLRLIRKGVEVPMVIATPPGFTNAADAKEELIKIGIPSIVVRGTYGGSNVAVAIFNELISMVGRRHGW